MLETTAKHNDGSIYVEWSTNEKAAMELAAGAAYCGARTMVTMKQVGLNVASDPLMSLAYIGVKGGMVILVADDPGPISSQTEQDTRRFAAFSKLPCFDPSGVQEAYDMIQEAFAYSERYHTPVLFRPTTRVCHGYASITVKDAAEYQFNSPEGFVKDSSKWVIFPKLSYQNHIRMEKRNTELQSVFSDYPRNRIYPETDTVCKKGIATHGISFSYTMEALHGKAAPRLLKVATPFPFPEQLAVEFLQGLDEVLCLEELDPVIEQELVYLCGKYHLPTRIRGKLTEDVALAGENSCDSVAADLAAFLGWQPPEQNTADQNRPDKTIADQMRQDNIIFSGGDGGGARAESDNDFDEAGDYLLSRGLIPESWFGQEPGLAANVRRFADSLFERIWGRAPGPTDYGRVFNCIVDHEYEDGEHHRRLNEKRRDLLMYAFEAAAAAGLIFAAAFLLPNGN